MKAPPSLIYYIHYRTVLFICSLLYGIVPRSTEVTHDSRSLVGGTENYECKDLLKTTNDIDTLSTMNFRPNKDFFIETRDRNASSQIASFKARVTVRVIRLVKGLKTFRNFTEIHVREGKKFVTKSAETLMEPIGEAGNKLSDPNLNDLRCYTSEEVEDLKRMRCYLLDTINWKMYFIRHQPSATIASIS